MMTDCQIYALPNNTHSLIIFKTFSKGVRFGSFR